MTTTEEKKQVKPIIVDYLRDNIFEDPDLKKLLPEITDDERKPLRDLIEAEGIREPLSVATIKGKVTLLDGHNRKTVAKELGLATVPVVFYDNITDIVQAEIWMIHNQLARRNMSDMERIQIILRLEPELKAQAKKRQGGVVENSAQVGRVVDIIAEMADVSRATIGQAKTIIATEDKELIALADNKISINRAYKLAKLAPEKRAKKVAVILQKISEEDAETATEEAETIQIVNTVYKKVSDLSYVSDRNNRVVSIKNVNGKPTYFSAVHTLGNEVYIEKFPETFTKHKARNIFCNNFDDRTYLTDDIYNETIHDITCLLDNIKTAKRITEERREKKRKEYLDAHPEAKPPKAPSAKDKKIEAQKKEIEALLKSDNQLTEAQKAEFKASPLIHKVLVKEIKKACNIAKKQFDTRIDDARTLGDMMTKHNLYEEQKEAIITTQYYADGKTFKLRMKDRLSKLADIVKAIKEATPKAIKVATPAEPKFETSMGELTIKGAINNPAIPATLQKKKSIIKKATPAKTAKAKAPAKTPTEAPEPQSVAVKKKSAKTGTAVKKATGKKSKK